MVSGADYPGYPEPDPDKEDEGRFPKIRQLMAVLWSPIARLLVAGAATAQMFIASFTGAVMAIEVNRTIAGQPPPSGLGYFYALLLFVFGAYYFLQDYLERNYVS